ncbi:MAG: L-threonylcarbamoyladenylate synthase [Marinilabiliaceae bacterium]|nr:L-threonylcarbamoyladenylate synthase [Marinilabiliaceae bacterium]
MIKSGKDVVFASKLIKEGKLVAFPTETVYGLGADGLNPKAVAKIFDVKNRPSFNPLILHVSSFEEVNEIFIKPLSPLIKRLADKYWPGPLTIVAPRQKQIPDIVTSGLPTVAVRMPNNPFALKLIRLAGVPIAAPSANLFGRISPTMPNQVIDQLTKVDYLIDGGHTTMGLESTIVSVSNQTIEILRPGIISEEQMVNDFPDIKVISKSTTTEPNAPGQMKSHYAPQKPLYLLDEVPEGLTKNIGLIVLKPMDMPYQTRCKIKYLSDDGDLLEAASNLFGILYSFEKNANIDKIYALKFEEEGIGRAIMDRLTKAAHSFTPKNNESVDNN